MHESFDKKDFLDDFEKIEKSARLYRELLYRIMHERRGDYQESKEKHVKNIEDHFLEIPNYAWISGYVIDAKN